MIFLNDIFSLLNNFIVALIAGIFTLLGILIGSYINRNTQHRHWLIQRRFDIFNDFLNTLHTSKEAIFDHSKSDDKIDLGLYLKLYTPVTIKSKSVLLILKNEDKKIFEKNINKIVSNHTFWARYFEKDYKKVYDLFMDGLNEIQKILESNLKSNKW